MLEDSGNFFRIASLLRWLLAKSFCIITSGVVVEGRRALMNFKKSMLFSIWYHKQKKKINFRGYSLIHINIIINLEAMRLIYRHQAISL